MSRVSSQVHAHMYYTRMHVLCLSIHEESRGFPMEAVFHRMTPQNLPFGMVRERNSTPPTKNSSGSNFKNGIRTKFKPQKPKGNRKKNKIMCSSRATTQRKNSACPCSTTFIQAMPRRKFSSGGSGKRPALSLPRKQRHRLDPTSAPSSGSSTPSEVLIIN